MKNLIFLFLLIQFKSLIGQNSLADRLELDVTPTLMRGMYGEILDSNTVELQCIFRGDTSTVVVFDYGDILSGKEWDTHCYTSINGIISNSNISQIILESEFGEMIPLSDNINFPSYKGYLKKRSSMQKSDFDFDLFAIQAYYSRSFKLSLSIPIHSLKICQDNQKVRLHYSYRTKKKYSNWSPNDYLLTSNWFLLSDIR
jgi:hypothetical protein